MKTIIIIELVCSFMILNGSSFGQSSLQIDLDHIVDISRATVAFQVEYLMVGKVIDITFWSHGCSMRKPLERTLRIERNTDSYTISFCELNLKMTCDGLIPVMEEFERSLLLMDPAKSCTTTQKVAIQNDDAVYVGVDASCDWKGFTNLTKALFNVLPHDPVNKTCLKDW